MARVGTSSDFKSAAFRSGIPMLKTMLLLMECLGLVNPKKAAANGRSLRGDTKINFIRHWWHALRNPFVRYWFWSPWKKGLNLPRPAVILITITKPWLSIHIFLVLNMIFLQIWLITRGCPLRYGWFMLKRANCKSSPFFPFIQNSFLKWAVLTMGNKGFKLVTKYRKRALKVIQSFTH